MLVLSSCTLIATDLAAEGADGGPAVRRRVLATIALGAVFLGNRIEYAILDFGADDYTYGSVYRVLTGLHGRHVAAGLCALGLPSSQPNPMTSPALHPSN